MLKEQANKEKDARIKNNIISKENMIISRMSTTAKECTPNVSNDENANNERKVMNENKWIKPKKCMQINYFYKKCENKAEWEMNNNKYIELVNNDEIEEGKVEEIKVNNNK